MKVFFKKIISCVLIFMFMPGLNIGIAHANGDGNQEDSDHYVNGVPVVRRQVSQETVKDNIESRRKRSGSMSKRDLEPEKPWEPKNIQVNNIVIFLRFKGEEEFITDENRQFYIDHYNGEELSLKSYMKDLSYGHFLVNSSFFPADENGDFFSYEVSRPRDFCRPYASNNMKGYKEADMNRREFDILSEAFNGCKDMIKEKFSSPEDLDYNCDDNIDNIIFVVKGNEDSWKDMLWPHQFDIPKQVATEKDLQINGKYVGVYNFMLESCFKQDNIGTTVHEFLHTLGYQDLYRYKSKGIPVGRWDLMSMQYPIPQFPLGVPRNDYGALCAPPIDISQGGRYMLYPSTIKDCKKPILYKIQSPYIDDKNEFFAIEYRASNSKDSEDTEGGASLSESFSWDKSLPNEGILIYRVNKDIVTGNAASDGESSQDAIFVFRPNISDQVQADGDIGKNAVLKTGDSLGVIEPDGKQSRYSEPDIEDTIYFSDEANSGIRVYNISIDSDKTATFDVEFAKTFITQAKLKGAKITIDNHNKRVLVTLPAKFCQKYIVPQVTHNGVSISPEDGIPLIISNDMKYVVTSPTGKSQVWKVITSPVAQVNCEPMKLGYGEKVVLHADVMNDEGATYQWFRDNKAIEGETGSSLIVKDPKDGKPHKMYVKVTNEAGSLNCAYTTISWAKRGNILNSAGRLKSVESSANEQVLRLRSCPGFSLTRASSHDDLREKSNENLLTLEVQNRCKNIENDGNYEEMMAEATDSESVGSEDQVLEESHSEDMETIISEETALEDLVLEESPSEETKTIVSEEVVSEEQVLEENPSEEIKDIDLEPTQD